MYTIEVKGDFYDKWERRPEKYWTLRIACKHAEGIFNGQNHVRVLWHRNPHDEESYVQMASYGPDLSNMPL